MKERKAEMYPNANMDGVLLKELKNPKCPSVTKLVILHLSMIVILGKLAV